MKFYIKIIGDKCFKKVDEAISFAKLKKEDIDHILLIGGSFRTPKIQQIIKDYFKRKTPLQNRKIDEVVAYGATLSAYVDVKLRDITSKDIGIEIANGKMATIIPRGTIFPPINEIIKFRKEFALGGKNPTSQTIKVYEGNSNIASENVYLGSML